MHNLAETYRELGDFSAAAKMHEEVLAIRKSTLGEGHQFTRMSACVLALTYEQQETVMEESDSPEVEAKEDAET